jgi:exodeoxyribonuclease VIII
MCGAANITNEVYENFVWIVIEKSAPFKIYLYHPERKWMENAEERIDQAIMTIERCQKTQTWPGPSTNIETLFVPNWMNT